MNRFGKKNFLGTFTPPFAVINDLELLESLSDRDWRSGTAEAVKVALIKDRVFFESIEADGGRFDASRCRRHGTPYLSMRATAPPAHQRTAIHLRRALPGRSISAIGPHINWSNSRITDLMARRSGSDRYRS